MTTTYVSDSAIKGISKFRQNGDFIQVSSKQAVPYPQALTIVGKYVIVTQPNKKVVILTTDLKYVSQFEYAGDGNDITHDGDELYLCYFAGHCIDVLQSELITLLMFEVILVMCLSLP